MPRPSAVARFAPTVPVSIRDMVVYATPDTSAHSRWDEAFYDCAFRRLQLGFIGMFVAGALLLGSLNHDR